jgi:hypothetical protein
MARHSPEIRLRPVTEADLDMFRRFAVEPGLIGLDWAGFRDPKTVQRRFDTDSYLGEDDGRLAGTAPSVSRPRSTALPSCWPQRSCWPCGATPSGTAWCGPMWPTRTFSFWPSA